MGRIHQLDAQTANMIAAGEVVERPMGVVKELVENAIDAGSTRISIAVEQGGIDRITITDNGCGMDSSDAVMAFQRHATSKIKGQNDLWDIGTLGFRGEALPSIASVSKLTLTTCDGNESTRVQISYGDMVSVGPYPVSQGTEITVEGLFYRTPARLKHLRAGSYENSLIQNLIMQFALSHPEIAFTFISSGKEAFRTSGSGDLQEVVYLCWGREPAENTIPVSFEDYDYKVTGMLVKPHVTRSSRNFMHIFLNGRMVKTFRLYKALQEGYEQFIIKDRCPMAILNIEMDPHLLDVNVHPSKWEVRLSKENQLEYLIRDQVHEILSGTQIAPKVRKEPTAQFSVPLQMENDLPLQMPYVEEEKENVVEEVKETFVPTPQPEEIVETPVETSLLSSIRKAKKQAAAVKEAAPVQETNITEVQETEVPYQTNAFPSMRVIGQYHQRYILCECENGIAVVDQVTSMERIMFEKAQKQLTAESPTMSLLVPVMLHVSDDIVRRVDELNAVSSQMSINFEAFGKDELIVRDIPTWMKDMNTEQFLQDYIESFQEDSAPKFQKQRIAKVVGRSFTGYKKTMSMEEMQALITQLSQCENPYTSSEGKTTFVMLEESEIIKEFAR